MKQTSLVRYYPKNFGDRSVCSIKLTPDGKQLITGYGDGRIQFWDLSTSNKCVQTLEGHSDAVQCLEFTPKGNLISASYDKTLKIWDLSTGKCLQTLKHPHKVSQVQVTSKGTILSSMTNYRGNGIRVWETGPSAEEFEIRNGNPNSEDSNGIIISEKDLIKMSLRVIIETNKRRKLIDQTQEFLKSLDFFQQPKLMIKRDDWHGVEYELPGQPEGIFGASTIVCFSKIDNQFSSWVRTRIGKCIQDKPEEKRGSGENKIQLF